MSAWYKASRDLILMYTMYNTAPRSVTSRVSFPVQQESHRAVPHVIHWFHLVK